MKDNELKKTLTLPKAVALAITMVIGSGLLIIPGLAYSKCGSSAIYSWILCAVATAPLLYVFATLGAHFPNAGGIAGYMRNIFSNRIGNATEFLLLATLPGGAALSMTGGNYLSRLLSNSEKSIIPCTIAIIAFGLLANVFGSKITGNVQQFFAALIILTLILVSAVSLIWGDHDAGTGIAAPSKAFLSLPAVGLVFFSFVGWELMSFTSEEFVDPKRDFPRMIYFSFIIVVSIYLLIAVTIQLILPLTSPGLESAPIASMIATVMGPLSSRLVLAIGSVIAITNYVSIVWAFSRFAYASSREGILPRFLSKQNDSTSVPQNAVITVTICFGILASLSLLKVATLSCLFELAGVSFFFSYCLCIIAWTKFTRLKRSKSIGILLLLFESALYCTFGLKAVYPIFFFIVGLLLPAKGSE